MLSSKHLCCLATLRSLLALRVAVPRHLRGFQTRNLTDAQRKNLRRCEASHTPTSRFALIQSLQALLGFDANRRFRMRLLIIVSFIAAVSVLAALAGIPRSHSALTIGRAGTAGMSSLQDMQSARGADQLPAEDFDDRSLVFPRESRR